MSAAHSNALCRPSFASEIAADKEDAFLAARSSEGRGFPELKVHARRIDDDLIGRDVIVIDDRLLGPVGPGVQQCRSAKYALLQPPFKERHRLRVLARAIRWHAVYLDRRRVEID